MISIDKLQRVEKIYVHENCADGVASAMILNEALPEREIVPLQYSTDEYNNLVVEDNVLFCDVTPPDSLVDSFFDAGAIILDHHKYRKAVVDRFVQANLGAFGDEVKDPGVCGAVLAYRHVWEPILKDFRNNIAVESRKEFARLAGVRDTWQKKDPYWIQACQQALALTFFPFETACCYKPILDNPAVVSGVGEVLWAKQQAIAERCVNNGYRFVTRKGTRVLMFEGSRNSSDAADLAGDSVDLVVGFSIFHQNGDLTMLFSLRSHTTYDCGAMSTALGGGGHTRSAGFSYKMATDDPQPFTLAQRIIETYEAQAV